MSGSRACALATAVVALLVPGLAACGGDDDEAEATPATTAAKAAPNQRLDQESWEEYVAARDTAKEVNDKAVTTFQGCRNLLGTNVDAEKVKECLGDSATSVVEEGQKLRGVIEGFLPEVSGDCAGATQNLAGYVKLYTSSVNAIAIGVEQSNLPNNEDIGSSTALLAKTRTEAAKFETACKPV
jgi:sarcosine oxidase delta subunit